MSNGVWTIRVRYKGLLEPLCWLRDHVWVHVEGLTAFDWSGRVCERCRRFQKCTCVHREWNPEAGPCEIHGTEVRESARDDRGSDT